MSRIPHALHPHSHDAADKVDAAMEASHQGMRVLWVSASILAATATAPSPDTRCGWVSLLAATHVVAAADAAMRITITTPARSSARPYP